MLALGGDGPWKVLGNVETHSDSLGFSVLVCASFCLLVLHGGALLCSVLTSQAPASFSLPYLPYPLSL